MNYENYIYVAIMILSLSSTCHVGACDSIIELDARGIPTVDYGFVSPLGDSSATEKEGWVLFRQTKKSLNHFKSGLDLL